MDESRLGQGHGWSGHGCGEDPDLRPVILRICSASAIRVAAHLGCE